ncbi:coiled-coil and C2 domain-containing protein 1-like isoform X2 [Aricia agestis]|uniref:coiled-coil and C2 domain-containing protein 1-like isoform X2 n=1 Tax=Aricia agestis TaxID=91739 RepID=UPI001C2049B8|nr:coiled-coil and C2 domain-containing protein 1-like isoform X2 [Aricia agestis]
MSRKPSGGKRGNLSQYGLIDIPNLDDDEPLDLSDDDGDLEAELAAISGGGGKPRKPKKLAAVPAADLDAMIAASLRDIPSDDEGSGDDDDPDLLNELSELAIDDEQAPPPSLRPAPAPPSGSVDNSTVSLLQERISNYTIAEKSAKEKGDNTRARRYGRGLKTLQDLLEQAKAGKPINNEEIPPAVSLPKPAAEDPAALAPPPRSTSIPTSPDTPSAPEVPPRTRQPEPAPEPKPEPKEPPPILTPENEDDPKAEGLKFILRRKEEFKAAALACKHAGDKALALEHLKVVKQFDLVVQAYRAGQEMDLNELPTPDAIAAAFKSQPTASETQGSAGPAPDAPTEAPGLITASTIDEALKQRLAHFKEQEAKAKEEGNSSKARRLGRVVKQFQDAIRMHAAGKPVPLDELPTPNGYAPFPTGGVAPKPAAPRPAPAPSPAPSSAPSSAPSPAPSARRASNYEKQLALLRLRQKQFKDAAYREKKNGNIEGAREYLRSAKGFEPLIRAAEGGLPVDVTSLPLPPAAGKTLDEAFDVISAEDCTPAKDDVSLEDDDVLSHMGQQLKSQLRLCATNRDHCRAMGDVAEANRYERLALQTKQDLDLVRVAQRLNQDPPKFHYENRQFSIVQCNTELPDNVLELNIVRGVAYNVPNPSDVDTYVKFEFGYPPEAPVSDRTAVIKDTSSPQYDATFTLPIARTSRNCQRFFKRHAIKLEVYSRGGWFSKDSLLGTVNVKLAPLETTVTIHDSFPLMDGRKAAGGTLEVRARVRSPLGAPQVVKEVHRWLVLDT